MLVGSEELANQYVEDSGDVYMARGHLAPKADFMYTTWQVSKIETTNARNCTNRYLFDVNGVSTEKIIVE